MQVKLAGRTVFDAMIGTCGFGLSSTVSQVARVMGSRAGPDTFTSVVCRNDLLLTS